MVARRSPLLWWLGAGTVGLFTVLALRFLPLPQGPEFTICFVRRFAGISCPGCGMTRAIACLVQGRFAEAYRFHPLSFLVAAELLLGWGLWGAGAWRGQALVGRRAVNRLLVTNAVLLLAVWTARFALGTLPP